MFKSFSSSYKYSNDGKNEITELNKKYKDNNNNFGMGVKKDFDLNNYQKKEMFYKLKENENKNRKILGRSKNNNNWELNKYVNNNFDDSYTENYNLHSKHFDKLPMFNNYLQNEKLEDNILEQIENEIPKQIPELTDYHQRQNILNERDFSLKREIKNPIVHHQPINEFKSYFNDDFFNF